MSKQNPYYWMSIASSLEFRKTLEAEEKAERRSRLTLVATTDMDINMETAEEQPAEPITTTPLYKHEAYKEMDKAFREVILGVNALKGIGAMMQPNSHAGDEQLDMARRSDISAIFEFFGEALSQRVDVANDAYQSLEFVATLKNM